MTEGMDMGVDVFEKLIGLAKSMGCQVVFMPMKSKSEGLITTVRAEHAEKDTEDFRIGIRMGMTFDKYVYNLAHELSHYFLHYDKGDITSSGKHEEYEEQADRAAKMLLAALSVK